MRTVDPPDDGDGDVATSTDFCISPSEAMREIIIALEAEAVRYSEVTLCVRVHRNSLTTRNG